MRETMQEKVCRTKGKVDSSTEAGDGTGEKGCFDEIAREGKIGTKIEKQKIREERVLRESVLYLDG